MLLFTRAVNQGSKITKSPKTAQLQLVGPGDSLESSDGQKEDIRRATWVPVAAEYR